MLASVIPGHGWGQAAQLSQRPQASATPCTPTLPSPASPHPALAPPRAADLPVDALRFPSPGWAHPAQVLAVEVWCND
jgi:hypothetical protein